MGAEDVEKVYEMKKFFFRKSLWNEIGDEGEVQTRIWANDGGEERRVEIMETTQDLQTLTEKKGFSGQTPKWRW